jgi:hypothetical protein
MRRFKKLTEIVRTISPKAELSFRGVPDRDDLWICLVSVGGVIIVDTSAGSIEDVLNEVIKKISRMSQRIRTAVAIKNGDSMPPPPSEEPDK